MVGSQQFFREVAGVEKQESVGSGVQFRIGKKTYLLVWGRLEFTTNSIVIIVTGFSDERGKLLVVEKSGKSFVEVSSTTLNTLRGKEVSKIEQAKRGETSKASRAIYGLKSREEKKYENHIARIFPENVKVNDRVTLTKAVTLNPDPSFRRERNHAFYLGDVDAVVTKIDSGRRIIQIKTLTPQEFIITGGRTIKIARGAYFWIKFENSELSPLSGQPRMSAEFTRKNPEGVLPVGTSINPSHEMQTPRLISPVKVRVVQWGRGRDDVPRVELLADAIISDPNQSKPTVWKKGTHFNAYLPKK